MSASTTGSLTTTGSVTLTKPAADTLTQIQISGTYGTVTCVIEGSIDGTNYFAVAAVDKAAGSVVTSTISPADNSTLLYDVPSAGMVSVRLRATAVASGTVAVAVQSGAYVGLPAVSSTSNTTFGNTSVSGTVTVTSASASALTAGPNGATNPGLKVNASTSSAAGGLSITGAADAAGVALAAIGSNTNEPLTLDGKGSGVVTIGSVSTGGAVVRTKVATVAVGGTAIGNANAVNEGFWYVTGANDTAAVVLPASAVGKVVRIKNTVANKILVLFPPVSSQINANGANNAYNIAAGATREFTCVTTTLWYGAPETIA